MRRTIVLPRTYATSTTFSALYAPFFKVYWMPFTSWKNSIFNKNNLVVATPGNAGGVRVTVVGVGSIGKFTAGDNCKSFSFSSKSNPAKPHEN